MGNLKLDANGVPFVTAKQIANLAKDIAEKQSSLEQKIAIYFAQNPGISYRAAARLFEMPTMNVWRIVRKYADSQTTTETI